MKSFKEFRKLNEAEPQQQQQQAQQTNPASTPENTTAAPKPAPQPAPAAPQQPAQPAQQSQPASQETRNALAAKIKPQYEVAKAVVEGIHQAFQNDCGKVTKYDTMGKQIKQFEAQIRNACKTAISIVEQSHFDVHNWDNCSPKSYKGITLHSDRDMDMLKLCAAMIIFYNSLIGKN